MRPSTIIKADADSLRRGGGTRDLHMLSLILEAVLDVRDLLEQCCKADLDAAEEIALLEKQEQDQAITIDGIKTCSHRVILCQDADEVARRIARSVLDENAEPGDERPSDEFGTLPNEDDDELPY